MDTDVFASHSAVWRLRRTLSKACGQHLCATAARQALPLRNVLAVLHTTRTVPESNILEHSVERSGVRPVVSRVENIKDVHALLSY
eukprot:573341-Prymnesium_polylepis.1